MLFNAGRRRSKRADATGAWTGKLESMYGADHPRHPGRYNAYLQCVAFLTAGIVEHHWTEGTTPDGHAPFIPRGRTEDFLSDLHKEMRAFRQIRHINGISSSELVRHSYELLGFLGEQVPNDDLERFLAMARTYIIQNEHECLSVKDADRRAAKSGGGSPLSQPGPV
jgi:hypothetical protein